MVRKRFFGWGKRKGRVRKSKEIRYCKGKKKEEGVWNKMDLGEGWREGGSVEELLSRFFGVIYICIWLGVKSW